MIIIDGYKEYCGNNFNMAQNTMDQLDFNGIRCYIGQDSDLDYYVFTNEHIQSEGLTEEECDSVIEENPDLELIKIELIN